MASKNRTSSSTAEGSWDRIIENVDLTKPLSLVGPEWNNTLVRNVTIHDTPAGSSAITLRDVSNVRIENSSFSEIDGMGILLSGTGGTADVAIVGNSFRNIAHHGIHAAQREDLGVDHSGLQIVDNTISQIGARGGDGYTHGIYVQAQDFLIEGNTVRDALHGLGITVRSSGVVRDNVVDGTGKGGIGYFSDHMHGPSDKLVIEGNEVDNAGLRFAGRAGIEMLTVAQQSKGYPAQSYEISNNGVHGEGLQVHPDYQRYGYDVTLANNNLNGAPPAAGSTPEANAAVADLSATNAGDTVDDGGITDQAPDSLSAADMQAVSDDGQGNPNTSGGALDWPWSGKQIVIPAGASRSDMDPSVDDVGSFASEESGQPMWGDKAPDLLANWLSEHNGALQPVPIPGIEVPESEYLLT